MNTNLPFDMKVLDFLRSQQSIISIKAGCRTGSCGTCFILVGELDFVGQRNQC
ncbi:MAG: hypothetical protein DRR08_28230 [Candidatus Parabeggiatoa sp. nov. 2]|nr:MAG: hypothetical protein B6247_29340 [Beggiatoa sp. 4572_84]RKZ52485.1 MAG: hypothetical protein DRR08_28230 [Gammaproteobacteria bacterium]